VSRFGESISLFFLWRSRGTSQCFFLGLSGAAALVYAGIAFIFSGLWESRRACLGVHGGEGMPSFFFGGKSWRKRSASVPWCAFAAPSRATQSSAVGWVCNFGVLLIGIFVFWIGVNVASGLRLRFSMVYVYTFGLRLQYTFGLCLHE
jgi:hypothetical protein